MAKSSKAAIGYQLGRLVEQSGGMVDAVVHPALLKDSEARLLKNTSNSEKGTVKTTRGRQERFAEPFDANNPCNGLTAYYPDTSTSRLVMGSGTKLYSDTPHLITKWTDQADFDEAGSVKTNADTSTTPGEIKVKTNAVEPTFTRASVAYLSDGTQVPANTPRFEAGKFGKAIMLEEGTTNLVSFPWNPVVDDVNQTVTQDEGTIMGQPIFKAVKKTFSTPPISIKSGLTIPNGATFTASIWCNQIQEATVRPAHIVFYKDGVGYLATTSYGTSPVGWKRLVVTYTNNTGAELTNVAVFFYACANAGEITYFAAPQLEQKPYATSFVDGTRSPETLTIPTAGIMDDISSWSIEFWGKQAIATNRTQGWFDGRWTSGIPVLIILNASKRILVYCIDEAGNNSLVFIGPTISTPGDWHYYAITYSTGVMKIYFDGAKIGEVSTTLKTNSGTNPFRLGYDTGSSPHEGNVLIDELRIDKVCRTDEEIAGWYNSGAPLMPDEHTTALFPFDGNLYNGGATWISATKDVSAAVDTASGKLAYAATIPGTSSITLETRTSADGTAWSAWTAILQDGTIQSAHQKYIQVRARLRLNGTDNPSIQDITLSYDGTPMAEELATGFTPGGQFYFATMLNTLIITNMLDPPKKWNGTDAVEELGGTPPHAQYIATHRNYVFMARTVSNPNRLYFSEVLNFDNWPALNFIDISPNDGDWITGLMPYDDYLIIAKNRSMWILVGTGPSDFEVRRIHDGVGCVAPRSLTKMAQTFVFASSEGLYMSDLSQEVLLSERLKETWRGLNQRRLNQIAAIYYDHKLRVDVPNGSSTKNNLRIVYDTIQKALSLEEFTDHASCYTKFTEAGQEILLYGHATEGQVSRADFGTTDNGEPITMYWGTKYFNFGSSAIEKKVRYLYLVVIPAMSDTQLDIYLVVNGVRHSTPLSVVVPGDALGVARTLKLDPRKLGIRKVKSIGYDIIQQSTNGGVKFHELLQEYMIKKIRETA